MKIAGIPMKKDESFGSYFGTTEPEPYDTGRDEFKPQYRHIFVSSEMYPGTDKSFFYVTSDINGKMRIYRHRDWFDTDVGNIFASGKTLKDAVSSFEYNFKNLIYNRAGKPVSAIVPQSTTRRVMKRAKPKSRRKSSASPTSLSGIR